MWLLLGTYYLARKLTAKPVGLFLGTILITPVYLFLFLFNGIVPTIYFIVAKDGTHLLNRNHYFYNTNDAIVFTVLHLLGILSLNYLSIVVETDDKRYRLSRIATWTILGLSTFFQIVHTI